MADYYSLLAKLLDGVPDTTPEMRGGVYGRARKALAEQLKTVQPPLTEAEIDREGQALEAAIARLEERFEGAPALPAAAAPALSTPAPPPPSLPRDGPEPEFEAPAPELEDRPEPIVIRRGRRRQRPMALVLILVLLAIPVAVLAWLWRDQQPASPLPEVARREAAGPPPPVDVKYGERVAGDATRPPAPRPAPQAVTRPAPPVAPAGPGPAAAPPPADAQDGVRPAAPAASSGGEIVIAQRALIFEENQVDPQRPIISAGRATWRLDGVSGGQGMPLETVIRGHVDLPTAGLTLNLVLRRNLDAALPASHTIELTFLNSPVNSSPARTVRDVALPLMRPEESIRGVAVAGLPVPVKENVFLIGLSDLKGDVEKNTELLVKRNWMELPIRFASGQKAALLFDKGVSGERVFLDAFRLWGQAPP